MPRIRTIKPEIFVSSQVMNLSRDARLAFIGLITQADDEGRGSADPRKIKATVFPGDDDIDRARIEVLLGQIEREGLIEIYDDQGGRVYSLPTWRRHQKIDRATRSSLAPPPRRSLDESSTTTRQGSEGSEGSERIGSDRSAREPSPDKAGSHAQNPEANKQQQLARIDAALNSKRMSG